MGLSDRKTKQKKKEKSQDSVSEKSNSPIIETKLDKIYKEVSKKQSITIRQIALTNNISLKQAEEWANTLDEQGLVELHYPLIGHAVLRTRGTDKKQTKKMTKTFRLILFALFAICFVTGIILILIYFMGYNV
jgi:ribosomal protein S25